jgi:surface carbohydrate biosynthesis protein
VNIYIVVEVAVRELEARLLLGLAAAERGHVVLVGAVDPREDPRLFPPGVFHDKSLTRGQEMDRQRDLARAGFVITTQDEEHGLLQSDFELFMERRFEEEALANVSGVFTWGPHDTKALKSGRPAYNDRFMMTGSPRADLWRPEFADYHRRIGLPEVRGREFVLFANNFVNLLGVNPFWVNLRDKRGKYFDGFSDPLEGQWFQEFAGQAERLPHVVHAIRQVALAEPETLVVVRPHPIEQDEAWRDLVGPLPNVLVTKVGPISRWVRSARVVVHVGDTTGFEVAIAGVPLISFEPTEGVAVDLDHVTQELGRPASTVEEVVALVAECGAAGWSGRGSDWRGERLIRERFTATDGRLAVDRIVDGWESLASERTGTTIDVARLRRAVTSRRLFRAAKSPLRPAARLARRMIGTTEAGAGTSFQAGHKFPPVDRGEVREMVAALVASTGRFAGVEVEILDDRLLVLHKPRAGRRSGRG